MKFLPKVNKTAIPGHYLTLTFYTLTLNLATHTTSLTSLDLFNAVQDNRHYLDCSTRYLWRTWDHLHYHALSMKVALQYWKTGVGMRAGVMSVQNHSISHVYRRVIAMQRNLPAVSSNVKTVEVTITAWDLWLLSHEWTFKPEHTSSTRIVHNFFV